MVPTGVPVICVPHKCLCSPQMFLGLVLSIGGCISMGVPVIMSLPIAYAPVRVSVTCAPHWWLCSQMALCPIGAVTH